MRTGATGGCGRIMVAFHDECPDATRLGAVGQAGRSDHRRQRAARPFEHADPIGPVTEKSNGLRSVPFP
jgi:hypothetical protein